MCLLKLGQDGIPYWAPHLPWDKADSPANSLGSLNEGNTTSVNPQKEIIAVFFHICGSVSRTATKVMALQPVWTARGASSFCWDQIQGCRTDLSEQEEPRGVYSVTHCKYLQTILYVKSSQIAAAAWKDTSQVSIAPQAHGMWHSHSKGKTHFWHNRILHSGIQETETTCYDSSDWWDGETCLVTKRMQSFLFLLIETESETFFKNNQYRQAVEHSNA